MSYKRVVQKGNKSYGPYLYESYRDENGIVRKRYLGKQIVKEKKKFSIWIFVSVGFLLLVFVGFSLVNDSSSDFNESYFSLNNKISGFVFFEEKENISLNNSFEEINFINKKSSNKNIFNSVSNFFGKITGFVVSDDNSSVEETLDDVLAEDNEKDFNEDVVESEGLIEKDVLAEENNTNDLIENNSLVEDNSSVEETLEYLNDSLEIITNETFSENDSFIENVSLNESVNLRDNFTNESEIINDTNFEFNETDEIILEPVVNESNISLELINESSLNLSDDELVVLREKVIVNKKVKWVVVYNKSNDIDAGSEEKKVKLPVKAENVSVIKGEGYVANEVSSLLNKANDEQSLSVSGGIITGNVVADENYGFFNGFVSFFKNLFGKPSLTGFVTSESELIVEQKIVRNDFETSVDISEEIEQEDVVAVSYYTDGPVSREKKLANGKVIVISAEEDLNYTNVSAYTLLNDSFKISMSEMNSVKLRWYENQDLISNSSLNDSSLKINSVSSFLTGFAVQKEKGNKKEKEDKQNIPDLNDSLEIITNETFLENDSFIENVSLNESIGQENLSLGDNLDLNNSLNLDLENETLELSSNDSYSNVDFNYFDYNNDGYVDYIEWNIPHLSDQSYVLIIEISDAVHLNENREVVDGIYSELSSLDGVVYEIPENNYLRVSFEQMLKEGKDITIYANSSNGASVEVYEKDSDVVLMTFENIFNFEENKLFFESMGNNWAQDTFDLKSVGGNVSYDYVVDPAYEIEFPQTFNIHGKLTDSSGSPLNGEYSMTFKIYNVPSLGSALYTTTKTVSCDSEGIYSVVLDNVDLPFNVQYYLGISVGGDSEMTPRIVLTSTPYAFRAQHVSASGIEFDSDLDMEDKSLITEGNITIGGATIYKDGNDLVFRV